jgi:hypothetical protein
VSKLDDMSTCPVHGKYYGVRMLHVPADFLLDVLKTKELRKKYPAVAAYVRRNRRAIDVENKEIAARGEYLRLRERRMTASDSDEDEVWGAV